MRVYSPVCLLLTVAYAAVIELRAPQAPMSTPHPNSMGQNPLETFMDRVKSETKDGDFRAALERLLPVAKITKRESMAPQVRPGAHRITARYGPYTLAAKSVRGPLSHTQVLSRRCSKH